MSLLDWFQKTYSPENAHSPYFNMPENRPKGNERHNLQQDLIDSIRAVAAKYGYDQEMINALIAYVEQHAGIKTFAESVDPFLQKVFDKRIYDIRNLLEGFFWSKGHLSEEDAEMFIYDVVSHVKQTWLNKEFMEIETVKAIGPDGKEKEFEKDKVPEGYKLLEENLKPAPEPPPVPEVPVNPVSPIEVPLQELPPEPPKPIQKEVGQQPAKKRKQRVTTEYW